jgi:transposase, IS30 family
VKAQGGRPGHPPAFRAAFWAAIRAGVAVNEASSAAGVSLATGRRWFRERGGVKPPAPTLLTGPDGQPRSRYLTYAEREEIMVLTAGGLGVRAIARAIARHPSTISRELRRVTYDWSKDRHRYARRYRASVAQADADRVAAARAASLAGRSKLATNARLRQEVQERLHRNDSPEQIAGRLAVDFPDDLEMRVSYEAIYQSLFVQGRGGLTRELTRHLRTGRVIRRPRRREGERRGRIPGMVNISERPAEVEDRAVPGHWEGDLILGSVASGSAIGTLVERATGFVMLLHLPGDHTALTVQEAMVAKMAELPEQLRRTLTWDQGSEMSNHVQIAAATGLEIFFCDPHAPWQRGSNENTNGLLRQYFPKGSDLSKWGPGYLDKVAAELNGRPRKRLGWLKPVEALDALLSEQNPPSVATTA